MKTLNIAVASLLLIAGEAFAASTVSDVVARQRWPWNGKVDIDYTVTGDKTDVDFYATWDGQATPVLIGTDFQLEAGQHRFEFDPSLSGFAGKTTTGFAVTASPAGADAHKYLVINLVDGGFSYLSDVPEGGWSDDYKEGKMVFARIPAGSAQLGDSAETLQHVNMGKAASDNDQKAFKPRTVTYTSDFYVGVFKLTEAQHAALTTGSAGKSHSAKTISYYALRGSTNADESVNIDWPETKYKVAPDSLIAKLRSKVDDMLVVDLCEEDQWEYAARCQTTTIWPTGGSIDDSYTVLSNSVNAIAAWYGSGYLNSTMAGPVGQRSPNAWGLYDVVGAVRAEWTLTCFPWTNTGTGKAWPRAQRQNSTDSVGPLHTKTYSDYDSWRIVKGADGSYPSAVLYTMILSRRQLADPSAQYAASTRFCIHLKSLNFDEHH